MILKMNPNFSDEARKKMRTLMIQSQQLKIIHSKLSERDEIMVKNCAEALTKEQNERAKIYAEELSRIRRILDFLNRNMIFIECFTVRLETYIEFNNFLLDMKPVLNVIKDVSQRLVNHVPQISNEIQLMNSALVDILIKTKVNLHSTSEISIPLSKDSESVMKEAMSLLEEQLKSKMPEPPTYVEEGVKGITTAEYEEVIALEALQYEAELEKDAKFGAPDPLDDVLLEYLKECGGMINMAKCSNDMNMTYDEIRTRLNTLANTGKIKIAG